MCMCNRNGQMCPSGSVCRFGVVFRKWLSRHRNTFIRFSVVAVLRGRAWHGCQARNIVRRPRIIPMAEKHTASGVFPQFPGEDFLAHAGTQYKEQAEARLASRSLLAVAQGDYPPSVKSIVDVDLDSLPELPVDHRDYTRRQETRIKIQTQNAANAEKRYDLLMTAWTEVYTLLKESTETTAPVLSRQLRMSCDLLANRNITGGYFDGPQAWRIVLHKLDNAHRSETDKDFYRSAERLQRASPLADGSPATDYSKRALAFLIHIRPHLPQSYDDDDTAQYLIRLMPKSLREGGRRITRELTDEGRLHDFMHVIQRCRELVQEEQKAAAAVPAFVVAPEDLGTHDLQLMERSTGMMLALPGQVSMAGTTNRCSASSLATTSGISKVAKGANRSLGEANSSLPPIACGAALARHRPRAGSACCDRVA